MLEVNAPSQIEALVSQVDGAVSIMMKQQLVYSAGTPA